MKDNVRQIACIIQARMGSSRLPGKSLMPLAGKPLIQHVMERAKLAKLPDVVIMATTTSQQDNEVAKLALDLGVSVFRGHETDLVDRYYHAASEYHADIVVRIPADNPLIHPVEIDRIIQYFANSDVDYASNICPFLDNKYPDGLGAEVFSFSALSHIYSNVHDKKHREHVTTYFQENPECFRLGTVTCPKEFQRPDIVLDVDTRSEYEFISTLFNELSKPDHLIHISEIIPWYDAYLRRNK